MSFWVTLGMLAFSLAVTFGTRWLAAALWQRARLRPGWLSGIVADVLWALILFAAAAVARRYIERISQALLGYLIFGLGALGLSLLRAFLYQRVPDRRTARSRPDVQEILSSVIHNLVYLLFASFLHLGILWLTGYAVVPSLFIPLFFGALLPDLDSQGSWLGHLLPFLSRRLETRLGPCQEWHTLAANAAVAMVTALLIPIVGVEAWGLIGLGFFAHLAVDLLTPQGLMLFWPVSHTRYRLSSFVDAHGSAAERRLATGLAILSVVMLFVVGVGRPPAPAPPQASFAQSMERYLSLRGRTLAFADVEGTWQATGRRVTDRFEILNAAGESLIMLDRYSGRVFSAGQGAADTLYLNRITVLQGAAVNIKPVQVHLQNQLLSEALPIVYQMQPEPGLQHIFISGDIVVPTGVESDPRPKPDYSQTELRRIVSDGEGHYSLRYLTASDLIDLAGVRVETADLVIVATYASPPAGPTATPLPGATPAEVEP